MAFNKNKAIIPVILIGIGAIVSHFLPSVVRPKKNEILIPETQEWNKKMYTQFVKTFRKFE